MVGQLSRFSHTLFLAWKRNISSVIKITGFATYDA